MDFYGLYVPDLFIVIMLYLMEISIPVAIILGFCYIRRVIIVLKILRKEHLRIDIIDETGESSEHTILKKEFKQFAKYTFVKIDGLMYRIMPTRIYRKEGSPYGLWREGQPIPIKLYEKAGEEDEGISGSELTEAIDSKIVHDLLKFTFTRMEYIYILIAIVGIIVAGINLYMIWSLSNTVNQIATYLNTLNNYLGKLIGGTSTGGTTITP